MPEEHGLSVRKPPPLEERPNIWKSDGNDKLTEGDYRGALQSYTRGIEAAREAGIEGSLLSQLYSNRAQAHSKLSSFAQAVEDCEAAIGSDSRNAKAYWRGANAAMKLGKPAIAADMCERGLASVGDSLGLQAMLDEARAQLSATTAAQAAEAEGEVGASESQEAEANGAELVAAAPATAPPSRERPVFDLQQVISTKDLAARGVALLERYRQAEESERDEDDAIRARRIFEKVLVQDRKNEVALIGLGEILDEGLGCEKDTARASQLWMMAINAGSAKAQVKMALQGLGSWAITLRAQALGDRDPDRPKSPPKPKPPPQPTRRWRPGDAL